MKRSRLTKRERKTEKMRERARIPPTPEEREQMRKDALLWVGAIGAGRRRWVTRHQLEQMYPRAQEDEHVGH
ncbi:MAG: hypothetical protein V4641_05820 [Pseudomonadota bacterium]